MNLRTRIDNLLNLEKFNNLTYEQKSTVAECIFAHCLILSKKNQDKYLKTIEECVSGIEEITSEVYTDNEKFYEGLVKKEIIRQPKDIDGFIYPMNYKVLFKMFDNPLNRLTRSVLHEFGHLVIETQDINLLNAKLGKDKKIQIDMGGLVVSCDLNGDYGHMFSEIINEFTTFLAFKSYLSYQDVSKESEDKMKKFVESMGMTLEKKIAHLEILPDDLYTSYIEESLGKDNNMFNPLYVKYSPLVKYIMRSFQNPVNTYQDLKEAFRNGEGLSASKNGRPINDLLYGYYESSFRPREVFDNVMSDVIDWESVCRDFDKEMLEKRVNINFVNNYLDIFLLYYERINTKYLNEGLITQQKYDDNMKDFNRVLETCRNHYSNIVKIK